MLTFQLVLADSIHAPENNVSSFKAPRTLGSHLCRSPVCKELVSASPRRAEDHSGVQRRRICQGRSASATRRASWLAISARSSERDGAELNEPGWRRHDQRRRITHQRHFCCCCGSLDSSDAWMNGLLHVFFLPRVIPVSKEAAAVLLGS